MSRWHTKEMEKALSPINFLLFIRWNCNVIMSNLEPHGGENFKNKIIQILKTKAEHEESILGPDSLELPWQP